MRNKTLKANINLNSIGTIRGGSFMSALHILHYLTSTLSLTSNLINC
ncbi:MAG: hypothetical protein NTW25_09000 [Candidatus Kapabacteria bacterium]|nr:hypothetical protein [Candidatus Kapabacteria bacterium]